MAAKATTNIARSQVEKFKQAARDVDAEQDEEAFKRRLKRVAKSPAPKAEKK